MVDGNAYVWKTYGPETPVIALSESGDSCMLYTLFGAVSYVREQAMDVAEYLRMLADGVERTKPMTEAEMAELMGRIEDRTGEIAWQPQEGT